MEGNSAKKVPVLESLVDTPASAATKPQEPTIALKQKNQPLAAKKTATLTQAKAQLSSAENPNNLEPLEAPTNRRTDKSQFEIELTQIVNQIMSQHIEQASEQIVQRVLREVRARLPGQRKH